MKMKLNLLPFLITLFVNAQVGINTIPHNTAALDMSGSKKGILSTRVALLSTADVSTIPNAKEGLLIYNTTSVNGLSSGYYFWSKNKWEPLNNSNNEIHQDTSTGIFASKLGYNPSGKSSTAPSSFTLNGVVATKNGSCKAFTQPYSGAIPHNYCGYSLSKGVDWETAFKMAKYLKGYLPVITSTEEWNYIKANSINSTDNSKNNIWIGYNIIANPGNPAEFIWITGEQSMINWSNSSTLQDDYAAQTNTASKNCVNISNSTANANRQWYRNACTSITSDNGTSFNYLLVEFNY
ncbi:Lectin C-type domain-containing protein [Chishuiella changwenlii]|uniref:Lectin C-type domain-containing protein n=2 Tax=Chishuiella changwenlii TaxID=1434701 RepID=A0A1M6U5H6_9FLAO|nr:C-type lectin domain-containing protein [Chishuiella changwenlii]SHK64502.1 Lectin C-type domain-containing protein [Chishuiella changwenlii]